MAGKIRITSVLDYAHLSLGLKRGGTEENPIESKIIQETQKELKEPKKNPLRRGSSKVLMVLRFFPPFEQECGTPNARRQSTTSTPTAAPPFFVCSGRRVNDACAYRVLVFPGRVGANRHGGAREAGG